MKTIIMLVFCCIGFQVLAQDSAKIPKKEYLGVLTLTKKYTDDKNWGTKEQAIVSEHFQRLVKYKIQGVVLLAGRTQYESNNPDMMGLVIFYAEDDTRALQFMMDDPAVKNQIMQTKVHPYSIALNQCK